MSVAVRGDNAAPDATLAQLLPVGPRGVRPDDEPAWRAGPTGGARSARLVKAPRRRRLNYGGRAVCPNLASICGPNTRRARTSGLGVEQHQRSIGQIPVRVPVARGLAHKSATMTLDLYGHLFGDRLDVVADAMGNARTTALTQALGSL